MPLRLETFSTETPSDAPDPAEARVAEARLGGFDAGYAAGWDDAAAAHAEERARVEAATTEALQTLGFTFQEARTHVLTALEPLLADIAAKLLPAIAHAALPALVTETIMPLAEGLAEPPVTLRLHPATREAIERLCVPALGLPVVIVEDAGLSKGDLRLTLDAAEARVDIDTAVEALTRAITEYFSLETGAYADAG